MTIPSSRYLLARFIAWFFLLNTGLYLLISLNYLSVVPSPFDIDVMTWRGAVSSYVFLVAAFVGQLGLFSIGLMLLLQLFALLLPWVRLQQAMAVLFATLLGLFLVADTVVYQLYHFHMLGILWQLLTAGVAQDVLALSWKEYTLICSAFIFLLLFEILLVRWLWKKIQARCYRGWGKYATMAWLACLLVAYSLMVTSAGIGLKQETNLAGMHQIVLEARAVPLFNKTLRWLLPDDHGVHRLETTNGGLFVQLKQVVRPMHYPLSPLQCSPPKKPLNIVFFVIDALRFDALNAKITPNLYRLAKKSWWFQRHVSGGNATGPGIFSLFYSIPYNYWSSVLQQGVTPVLLNQLEKRHYQLGVFRSASLHYPAFDRTIFLKSSVKDTEGDTAFDRDQRINQRFFRFIDRLDRKRPFFSFVFYDGAHNYCQKTKVSHDRPFKPEVADCDRLNISVNTKRGPYFNRYHNAAYFDDQLLGGLIAKLKQARLWDNTVVLVTSDHGEELNDSHQRFWGHASAYDQWQLHVPFVLHWPGARPKQVDYRTSHYDVVPSLLQRVLHCRNPESDYSVGLPLWRAGGRGLIIADSYIDYAILQKDRVTRVYPVGELDIKYFSGGLIPHATPRPQQLQRAFSLLKRYYS